MTPQEQYEHLVETVKSYNPAAGFDQIRAAYEFAAAHHAGQNRKDGSPYITHPLAVAQIVADELELDTDVHCGRPAPRLPSRTPTATHEEISQSVRPHRGRPGGGRHQADPGALHLQRGGADGEPAQDAHGHGQGHPGDPHQDMPTGSTTCAPWSTRRRRSRSRKSLETMEIYAPIAHRLGMQKIKWELEDPRLKYLDPVGYQEITEALDEQARGARRVYGRRPGPASSRPPEGGGHRRHGLRPHEAHLLHLPQDVHPEQEPGRACSTSTPSGSSWTRSPTATTCWASSTTCSSPILGRFKDYIGTPKPNMYQSLHTTVIGESGIPFEVQIRTWEMHEVAEYGVAAHWKYKQDGTGRRRRAQLSSGCAACWKTSRTPTPRTLSTP